MLEHTILVEFYKKYIGENNLHLLHGAGTHFRFACNETNIAIYEIYSGGTSCIYNDAFPKCVDRSIVYNADILVALVTDIKSVYKRNGGVLADPMTWLSTFTNRSQELCVSLIPHVELFPNRTMKTLFMVGKNIIMDCEGVLVRSPTIKEKEIINA